MRLDLSGRGWSGDVAADALEVAAVEVRRPFVELMDRLSAGRDADLDWWVTPMASRNTYACPLHLRLCRLVLARRLLAAGGVEEILVDSPALALAVSKLAGPGVRLSVIGTTRLSRVIGVLRRFAGALYHVGCQFIFSRLLLRPTFLPAGPVVLVDTFLYADSIKGGRVRDRHYPGLTELLDDDERRQVFFVPSYFRVRNYARFFRELSQARGAMILKEDLLGLGDYLYALAHPFRLRWPQGPIDFLGMEVGPLVREAMAESFAASGAVEGLLRYRFARRAHASGLSPRRIIEWFENQEIDHGAAAGWRSYFPDVPVIGYQGFLASRHYLCMYPMTREADLKLLPQRVAVMGSGLVAPVREFCPELNVETAPAFRFESVWRERRIEPDPDWFTVLVALPILPPDSRAMLAQTVAIKFPGPRPWRFRVKPHPTWTRAELGRLAAGLPDGFELVEGDFETLLDGADALVGAASSTCVHAIVRGVPVVVAAQPGSLVQNPIPVFAAAGLWAVCYTADDLTRTLALYAGGRRAGTEGRRELGRQLRASLFEPVTAESVRHFLGFDGFERGAHRAAAAH